LSPRSTDAHSKSTGFGIDAARYPQRDYNLALCFFVAAHPNEDGFSYVPAAYATITCLPVGLYLLAGAIAGRGRHVARARTALFIGGGLLFLVVAFLIFQHFANTNGGRLFGVQIGFRLEYQNNRDWAFDHAAHYCGSFFRAPHPPFFIASYWPYNSEIYRRAWYESSRGRNVCFGSLADKPPQAKIHLCPLLSNNGQIVAVPRLSAMCHRRHHAIHSITSSLQRP
jgi:hypothetical protein